MTDLLKNPKYVEFFDVSIYNFLSRASTFADKYIGVFIFFPIPSFFFKL